GLGYNYWKGTGEKDAAVRAAYKDFITTTFKLIGDATPEKSAQAVYDLEKKIFDVSWSPDQQRDVKAEYNPMDLAGLKKLAPTIDWPAMLEASGLKGVDHVVVGETTEVAKASQLIASQPLDTWKKFLAFHMARTSARYLPKAMDDANFAFYGTKLQGVEQ